MARKNRKKELIEENERSFEIPKSGRIIVPSGDRRHITKIRLGKIDTSEVFSKKRLSEIPVDND